MTDNTRAALMMTLSMAMFAMEDAFLKQLSGGLPVYQILVITGLLGGCLFWIRLKVRGQHMFSPALLHPLVIARNLGEVGGTFGFVTALAMGSLAATSAILQVLPLTIVLGAALFLGEKIGWQRGLSIAVGLIGVLIILRPGSDAIEPGAIWAVFCVLALTVRDLATRIIPASVPSDQLSGAAYAAMVPAGVLFGLVTQSTPAVPTASDWLMFAGILVFGATGYTLLVSATRLGEASAVAPFRYTRLAFALIVAMFIFAERPDMWTVIGSGLIVGSGAYGMWREALNARRPVIPDSYL